MTRRTFVASTAMAAGAAAPWEAGRVKHLLPAASHNRLRIKTSFDRPLGMAPKLVADGRTVEGERTDTAGLFWAFDIGGLRAGTPYELGLIDAAGKALCAPWTLKTLPDPEESPGRFRLMVYTCAGGHDGSRIKGTDSIYWVPLAQRRQMLARGLEFQPDAVIANGDHIYWDLRFGRGQIELPRNPHGDFERDQPVLGTENEPRLLFTASAQISELYGNLFRSTPVWFLQDDHDYYENDEAHSGGISFPPDDFMLRLARATRRLYFPEFLPEGNRPAGLPGTYGGLSEAYGTLRWGKLAEILLYDCRRYLTLKGPFATFVPETVEAWLKRRMGDPGVTHTVNLPSTPIGWSAGKWGEWYPDLLMENGKLGVSKPKYFWQPGWKAQHDRLAVASSEMKRIPLFVSGDLHALGLAAIRRIGAADLSRNPVQTLLAGPISTGPKGWPSSARGTPPQVPDGVELETSLPAVEFNGFTLLDFLSDRIEVQMFRWKLGRPDTEIAALNPFHRATLRRQ